MQRLLPLLFAAMLTGVESMASDRLAVVLGAVKKGFGTAFPIQISPDVAITGVSVEGRRLLIREEVAYPIKDPEGYRKSAIQNACRTPLLEGILREGGAVVYRLRSLANGVRIEAVVDRTVCRR